MPFFHENHVATIVLLVEQPLVAMSARSVAASYKPPMRVTRARLPACALACASRQQPVLSLYFALTYIAGCVNKKTPRQELAKLPAKERADKEPRQDSLAEGSKELAQGAGPQGRGLERAYTTRPSATHAIKTIYNIWMRARIICAKFKRLYV